MVAPIIIDIEASGFGKGSYPIEVGYVSSHGHPWCALIKPCDVWTHWDETAEKLHHITRKTLMQNGKSVAEVAGHLNDIFRQQTVYTDGWLQDFTWISSLFEFAELTPLFKLEDLRNVLSPYQKTIWHETKQSILNDAQSSRHRASADAQVLQLTWLKTKQQEALSVSAQTEDSNVRLAGLF